MNRIAIGAAVAAFGLAAAVALPAITTTPQPASAQEDASGEFVPERPGQIEDPGTPRFSTAGWSTDFTISSVPFDEIFSGGPGKDGIPAIDSPDFESIDEARSWVTANGPVIALEIDGDARAYPLAVLTWHEIVNDTVGDVPVIVTFCPLCHTALAFERTLDGTVHDFGVSGNLRFSDMVMYDRQTETWWQQATGQGIVGDLTGAKLEFLPSQLIGFDQSPRPIRRASCSAVTPATVVTTAATPTWAMTPSTSSRSSSRASQRAHAAQGTRGHARRAGQRLAPRDPYSELRPWVR